MPLQEGVPHEETDTGVRFLSWGQNARRLYSGSSDGVVKVWDVMQSQENTLIKDLVSTKSGIMSGAFAADFSKLVLGEVDGTAHVLEVGREDIHLKDAESLQYHRYLGKGDDRDEPAPQAYGIPSIPLESAAAEARKWLETGQLQLAPAGGLPKQQVVQGPNYEGPYDRIEDAYTLSLRRTAFEFQHNMAVTRDSPCDLPGCADNINTTTYEDVGDSGRSRDRIPDEFRRQWLDESSRGVPGRTKCTRCGRSALPSTEAENAALCERCSFACFRCGNENLINGIDESFACECCGGMWDIGALGYENVREPDKACLPVDLRTLREFGREAQLERLEDADTTFGDDMNALTDYYFGLAIDRPESPEL